MESAGRGEESLLSDPVSEFRVGREKETGEVRSAKIIEEMSKITENKTAAAAVLSI